MENSLKVILSEVNIKLNTFYQHYPKLDWVDKVREDLILNFSFHSNKIEGLGLSYGETISYLKTGLIENKNLSMPGIIADITMLNNHQKALRLILDEYTKAHFSIDFILKIHEQVLTVGNYMDEINRPGVYRGDDCIVKRSDGTTKYFLYDNLIAKEMDKLVLKTNESLENVDFSKIEKHPLTIAVNFHVDFLNIHPFRDGNGRTARLLMNMVNMKFKIPPFSPRSDTENRLQYFKTFDECDNKKSNIPMVEFLGKQLIQVLDQAIQKAKSKPKENNKGIAF